MNFDNFHGKDEDGLQREDSLRPVSDFSPDSDTRSNSNHEENHEENHSEHSNVTETPLPPENSWAAGYQPLDPREIVLERIAALIISVVLGVAALVGTLVSGFGFGFVFGWMIVVGSGWVLLSLLIAFLFYWPPISYRHVRWKLDQVGFEIQRGVFWRHTISIPLARLQHADLTQGPLQRQWGLAKLTVYTAGTQHASVELDGLAYETAACLRDRLLRQQGVGDVV